MRCALIGAMKRSLRFAVRSRKNLCRIVDETTLPPPAMNRHNTQQLRPNRGSVCISIAAIFAKSSFLACFSGHCHNLSQPDGAAAEGVRDDINDFRAVWYAALDPATATADGNYLMVHTSMRYAIFI